MNNSDTKSSAGAVVVGAAAIIALTLFAYAQVIGFGFVNYDDNDYVYENDVVQDGLTWRGVAWAFTTRALSNWHPLTWLSYMIDVEVFGVDPGAIHAVNLGFHLVNSVLLLILLWRLTGQPTPATLVAALFALHPLHVESVAWISERKDVLSTFFGLLAILAYAWYAARPSIRRNMLVTFLLALGLMAKPMLVTWPALFLVLDYWPLQRSWNCKILAEKLPHVAVAAASCVVTYIAQQSGGAVRSLDAVPIAMRVQNGLVAYGVYLWKMIWPADLAVLYPYPAAPYPAATIAGVAALLAAVTLTAWLVRRSKPYMLVGWLWYVGTLAPVIGLVQVGRQAYADRYTYIPLIGVFMAVAWLAYDILRRRSWGRNVMLAAAAAVVAVLGWRTYVQVSYWRDSVTLYERALAVTSDNAIMHYNLGTELLAQKRLEEAERHLDAAARLRTDNPNYLTNLGVARLAQGKLDEAERALQQVTVTHPDHAEAYINLGLIALRQERWDDAIRYQARSVELDPGQPQAWLNYAVALEAVHREDDAQQARQEAARLGMETLARTAEQRPEDAAAAYALGNSYLALGQWSAARQAFERAIALDPGHAAAEVNLGIVLASQQNLPEAIQHLRRALAINMESVDAHFNLALALHLTGDNEGARKHVEEALRLHPDDTRAQQLAAQLSSL